MADDENGGQTGDLLDDTEESFDDLVDRLEGTVYDLTQAVDGLAGHLNNIIGELAKLNVPGAVAEVPAAAKDVVQDVSQAAGKGAETVGEAVAVPVAAVEDVADVGTGTAQAASEAVAQANPRKFRLRKVRR